MIYFIYWVSIFILGFSLCSLLKFQQYDEDELPFNKEQFHAVIRFLLIISFIFLAVSLPFLNYKKENTFQNNTDKITEHN